MRSVVDVSRRCFGQFGTQFRAASDQLRYRRVRIDRGYRERRRVLDGAPTLFRLDTIRARIDQFLVGLRNRRVRQRAIGLPVAIAAGRDDAGIASICIEVFLGIFEIFSRLRELLSHELARIPGYGEPAGQTVLDVTRCIAVGDPGGQRRVRTYKTYLDNPGLRNEIYLLILQQNVDNPILPSLDDRRRVIRLVRRSGSHSDKEFVVVDESEVLCDSLRNRATPEDFELRLQELLVVAGRRLCFDVLDIENVRLARVHFECCFRPILRNGEGCQDCRDRERQHDAGEHPPLVSRHDRLQLDEVDKRRSVVAVRFGERVAAQNLLVARCRFQGLSRSVHIIKSQIAFSERIPSASKRTEDAGRERRCPQKFKVGSPRTVGMDHDRITCDDHGVVLITAFDRIDVEKRTHTLTVDVPEYNDVVARRHVVRAARARDRCEKGRIGFQFEDTRLHDGTLYDEPCLCHLFDDDRHIGAAQIAACQPGLNPVGKFECRQPFRLHATDQRKRDRARGIDDEFLEAQVVLAKCPYRDNVLGAETVRRRVDIANRRLEHLFHLGDRTRSLLDRAGARGKRDAKCRKERLQTDNAIHAN